MNKIKVHYTHDATVTRIVLNDGKGNVLDHEMLEQLQSVLDECRGKPALKLITFEGAGKHFSFGASVEEHQREYAEAMLKQFHQVFYTLSELSVPTLAKVRGQCLGGGMELAIMCNVLFADTTAKFGQPEISLGVFAPPASVILPEKIGLARAEDLLITGRILTAGEAHAMGLVNAIFEDEQTLEEETQKWIAKYILPKSASSLRFAVRAARVKFNHVLSDFLPLLERIYVRELMATADANEGIRAFMEKRAPEWEHTNMMSQ
jgi:cyclohexa-1,5-dienecarbonyl-CoA hydratase